MDHKNSSLMHDVVIIGGGVAGISAALYLAEQGIKPLIIEAGSYPAHKICGEFFSPESRTILNHLALTPPVTITNFNLITPTNQLNFQFPTPAGSMSRFMFDHLLVQKARQHGITVLEHERVDALHQMADNTYSIKLASGNSITAQQLIIGAGRVTTLLTQKEKPIIPLFVGIKAHFQGTLPDSHQVYFYTFPGAYLGISMVDTNTINIACLAQQERVKQHNSIDDFMHALTSYPHASLLKTILHEGKKLFPEWLSCSVPAFGIKQTPALDNVYFVGDAAGFKLAWKQKYGSILRNGGVLHEIMMRPWLTKLAVTGGNAFPRLARLVFAKTRSLESEQ